jgi:release factor glutamine methyltransferase
LVEISSAGDRRFLSGIDMMRNLVQFFGKPIRKGVQWYLSKPRNFKYENIDLTVYPGVFHPGFFFSSRLILKFLATQNIDRKSFLELGCGSGIISIFAAKQGANVTAIDINQKAVDNTLSNSIKNDVNINVLESDLFSNVPAMCYDWIVINPPYYPVDPRNKDEYAWNCGLNHQYFYKLFKEIGSYITTKSQVLMILSDVCDLQTIFSIAASYGFAFEEILQQKVWADGQNYLFWVKAV